MTIAALAATLAVYHATHVVYARLGAPALLHPALTSILLVGFGLALLGIDHAYYFAAAYPLHAALVPMTVLLAVPLCRNYPYILNKLWPMVLTIALGCLVTLLLSAGVAVLSRASAELAHTLLAKSVTIAIAIGITERTGGLPELTPALVIASGIVGACLGPWVCRILRVTDDRAIGLALGIGACAIGAARAFQISDTAGAYATAGMILNGIATAAFIAVVMDVK